jgi:hypothetical protein
MIEALARKLICIVMRLKHPNDYPIFRNELVQFSFDPNNWIRANNSVIIRFISTKGSETFDNYIPYRACGAIINHEGENDVVKL